jgi:hypothetical protein
VDANLHGCLQAALATLRQQLGQQIHGYLAQCGWPPPITSASPAAAGQDCTGCCCSHTRPAIGLCCSRVMNTTRHHAWKAHPSMQHCHARPLHDRNPHLASAHCAHHPHDCCVTPLPHTTAA